MKMIVKQFYCTPTGGAQLYTFRDENLAKAYHVEVNSSRWTAALVSTDGERTGITQITSMDELGAYLDNAFKAVKDKLNR